MENIHFNKEFQSAFWDELRLEVKAYFHNNNISPYASKGQWVKMITLIVVYVCIYLSLFMFSLPLWSMWLLAFLLGLGMCAIGFNISHQAAHGALSKNHSLNRIMGFSFNLMGMSDYLWMLKHNVSHHAYTNIYENDEALKEDETLRLSEDARWYPYHRFQHIYTPFVYALFTIFWATTLDLDKLRRYNGCGSRSPKPHPATELMLFWMTKVFYITVYFVLPLYFLPVSFFQFCIGFVTMQMVGSSLITHILQVEHLNEEARVVKAAESGSVPVSWAVNQLEGTADFRVKSRIFQWFIGPVNYQIEHHLFPHIEGAHLPAVAKIVEAVARKYGLAYHVYPSFWSAVISHYKLLEKLGRKPLGLNALKSLIANA